MSNRYLKCWFCSLLRTKLGLVFFIFPIALAVPSCLQLAALHVPVLSAHWLWESDLSLVDSESLLGPSQHSRASWILSDSGNVALESHHCCTCQGRAKVSQSLPNLTRASGAPSVASGNQICQVVVGFSLCPSGGVMLTSQDQTLCFRSPYISPLLLVRMRRREGTGTI